jgi:hypothetical protein
VGVVLRALRKHAAAVPGLCAAVVAARAWHISWPLLLQPVLHQTLYLTVCLAGSRRIILSSSGGVACWVTCACGRLQFIAGLVL